MGFDWQVYAKLFAVSVLSASVVSTLINVYFNSRKDARDHRREAAATAASAVQALEAYYCTAARMIVDADIAQEEVFRGEGGGSGIGLPKFAYPEGMDWKWLAPKTVSRLRSFPAAREATQRHLAMEWEHSLPPDHLSDIAVECAKLANKAWALAQSVRAHHRLGEGVLDAHDRYIPDLIARTLCEREEAMARMIERTSQMRQRRRATEAASDSDK
ncbi:hypothetical protein [Paraburkholderia nemoris]|uniref:Uncharacterized protein n=1 Tax=Paraburkholderia nemoris TaxID=2793076 RepID=A0ABN7M5B8_9BURK|nr:MULTISPECIES: hypothetical protein [Paraburkholderia]KPD19646.1 hypothetical protein ADM96_04125 [Burkholderia sp. ST111]MBK3812616.1 hypothetical protein [Paraburkholderia aspalathi]CAE6706746.1 hypothetical protein R75777_00943 [Paraburkholderia nemoris]CAE6786386.1 hypothetical protein R69776_04562 [Paraburkholderia nemoris]